MNSLLPKVGTGRDAYDKQISGVAPEVLRKLPVSVASGAAEAGRGQVGLAVLRRHLKMQRRSPLAGAPARGRKGEGQGSAPSSTGEHTGV